MGTGLIYFTLDPGFKVMCIRPVPDLAFKEELCWNAKI